MFKWIALIITTALLAQVTLTAHAQAESTPTPAPSKTPTQIVPTATGEVTQTGVFESLTQADLSILTANVQRPNGIAWFNDTLYTACTGDGTIYEINDTTGQTRTYIYGVRNAHMLYPEEDANRTLTLWVPDYAANTLLKVTRSSVQPVVRDLHGPWGIAYVDEEHFLVTNLLGNTLNLLSRDGDDEVVLEGLTSPAGIAHDDEILYIANYGSTRRSIEWYPLDDVLNGEVDDASSHVLVSGLQNATGVQLGSDGKLYFAYALGNRGLVGRVDPQVCRENGGCTNEEIEIVLYSDLEVPLAGLTLTPDMRLFVHTMFVPDVYWAQISG
jgi:hypothetical protein